MVNQRSRASLKQVALSCCLCAWTYACGSEAATPADEPAGESDAGAMPVDDEDYDRAATLELYSAWRAPGEAEALDSLIQAHRSVYPNITVNNLTLSGDEGWYVAAERFGWKCEMTFDPNDCVADPNAVVDPVDLMQWDLEEAKRVFVARGIRFSRLNDLFEANWSDTFLEVAKDAVTSKDDVVAFPVGVHRTNSLIYNRQVLKAAGVSDPETWTSLNDLVTACEQVEAQGLVCLSTSGQPFAFNTMLSSALAMTMGPEGFAAYYAGKGDPDDPRLVEAVTNFDVLVKQHTGGKEAWAATWDAAVMKVYDGDAAMMLHGDWAVGMLKTLGWDETDFGVVAAPGTADLLVYIVDGFMLPEDSAHNEDALRVVRTWLEPAALAEFAKRKGASPPRKGLDLSDDPLAAQVYGEVVSARFASRERERIPWFSYYGYVAGTYDVDDIVAAIRKEYE